MAVKNGSPSGQFNMNELKNLGKTSVLVGTAAALTYFAEHVTGISLGENSAIISSVLVVVVKGLLNFLQDNTKVS